MKHLDQIIALTDAIEAAVSGGDWVRAAGLDLERRALLVAAFAAEPDAVADSGTRRLLEELLARNASTIARIQDARRALDGEARQLAVGARAVRSYHRNGIEQAAVAAGGDLP